MNSMSLSNGHISKIQFVTIFLLTCSLYLFFVHIRVDRFTESKNVTNRDKYKTNISSVTTGTSESMLSLCGFYGPNNQVLSHLHGLRLAQACGVRYADTIIRPHRGVDPQPVYLSDFLSSPIMTQNETDLDWKYMSGCVIDGPNVIKSWKWAPARGAKVLFKDTQFFRIADDDLEFSFKRRTLCDIVRKCNRTYLRLHFRDRHPFNMTLPSVETTFTDTVTNLSLRITDLLNMGNDYLCMMIRQRDEMFHMPNPFAKLPLFNKLGCRNNVDCIKIASDLHRQHVNTTLPVLLVSKTAPNSTECSDLRLSNIFCWPTEFSNSTMYAQLHVCNGAKSIGYTDNMSVQVGMGAGASTLYEMLVDLGRNTKHDYSFSQMIADRLQHLKLSS
ncbi:hypothetical protein SARC_13783 [Sphaeroforma arctica JP610]|uniref:Uncharacterized protein n=1 Tax=Sphaeroforma arctica JP610 TaxID=667725 RepID=A0A0L0FC57_9EUKA|nr:hypothetical protein SARC_13783 [Sphaeroforma arctica JP610]KNC73658.1 hypothetical protein SARC_13783 [Sphaeroforma arctica JP610]|eukprot:XP_014147560.1 hypothetical protein SARC_13783 [Sphaeroforma arctica JP610]